MEFRGENIRGTERDSRIVFMDVADVGRVAGFIDRFGEGSVTVLDTSFDRQARKALEDNNEAYVQAVRSFRERIFNQPDEIESVKLAKHYDGLDDDYHIGGFSTKDSLRGFSDQDEEWEGYGIQDMQRNFTTETLWEASVKLRVDLAKGRVALFALNIYSPVNESKESEAIEMRNTGGLDGTLETYVEGALLEKIAPHYEAALDAYRADVIEYGVATARHLFNTEAPTNSFDAGVLGRLVKEGYIASDAARTLHLLIRERMDKEVIERVQELKAKYGGDNYPDLLMIDKENPHLRKYSKDSKGNVVVTEVSGYKWFEYDASRDIHYTDPDDSTGYYLP